MPATYGWSNYKGKRRFRRARTAGLVSSGSRVYDLSNTQSSQGSQRAVVVSVPRNRFRSLDTKVFRTRRTIQQVIAVGNYSNTGWVTGTNIAYPDLCMTHALSATSMWINNAIVYQPVLSNASEFVNLFDHYRIDRINITGFFSANQVLADGTTTAEGRVLPILHIMNDYNTTTAQTLSNYLEHPECRHIQLGINKTFRHSYVPRVRELSLGDNDTTTYPGVSKPYQWIDTNSPSIAHFGTRFYLDTFGLTGDETLGRFQFLVEYELSFKSVK